ncbi:MAG: PAS domain S-box protein, partial [Nitrospira sp.]|nr:PAS domain S-box protein [Nitrospira sp.]
MLLLNQPLCIDTRGNILIMNEISARRLGKTPNELIGSCIYDILPPDVAKLRKEKIDGVIHSGETVRFEDERQGMWFDQTIYPIFDKQGNVEKLTVFAIDITERKKTEEEIRKLNEDLKHRSIELEAINKELEAFS